MPMQVYNSTSVDFANRELKQKRSKAIKMIFYRLQDRVDQCQFNMYWGPGKNNLRGYHTTLFPSKHHVSMCSTCLYEDKIQNL